MKKKTKLLCCIHDMRGRGAERVLATLLSKFDRERFQLALFVYHGSYAVEVPADVSVSCAGIDSYSSSACVYTKIRMNIIKIAALGRFLRSYRPDVALSVAGTNEQLIIARYLYYRKVKVIISEHTMPSAVIREHKDLTVRYLAKRLIFVLYPCADLIVTPGKAVKDDLNRNFAVPSRLIREILNPLDIERIRKALKKPPNYVFAEDGCFRIGFVGGLSKEKNIPCLLKAFAALKRKQLPVSLFIIGDGPEKDRLPVLSKELGVDGAVHFLGFQEKPYALIGKLNALVLPSFYEVFPNVLLEAMACEVPVVSSKWVGAEQAYHDNENCLLFPLDDHEALTHAIEQLYANEALRTRLVKNGLELAAACDADIVVKQYQDAIVSVAGRKTSRDVKFVLMNGSIRLAKGTEHMIKDIITAALHPLFKNSVYIMRHGLAKGLKRKGGLGFIPFVRLTREEVFLTTLNLEGKTIYDIGGFIGIYTLFFARAGGQRGRVITFEPNAISFERIAEIVALNKFDNVEVRPVALGSARRKGTMVYRPSDRGTASLQDDIRDAMLKEKGAKTIQVDVDTLDNQIDGNNLPAPDFIKIDVEGLEADVLAGMSQTMRKFKPHLFIEIHGLDMRRKNDNIKKVVQSLLESGYAIHHVESGRLINSSNAETAREGHLYCV